MSIDKSYYRTEPRRWCVPKPVRVGGFTPKKPSPIRYRIVDSAHYEGPLEMPKVRCSVYVVSREGLGDCWWTRDHPALLPVSIWRA